MKDFFKPFKIVFYLLMLFTFFMVGLYVATAIEAGKNQGLAGGAIFLSWGILFGFFAFIGSFVLAHFMKPTHIKKINWILLIIILITYGLKYNQYRIRDLKQQKEKEQFKPAPTTPTKATAPASTKILALLNETNKKTKDVTFQKATMPMGFFKPNWYENKTLYFFRNIPLEKSLQEHLPYDSITFKQTPHHSFEIATAPPWLVPKVLKMDYDLLYFSVVSVAEEFVEIIGNETNQQTTFVAKQDGKVIYWPEFLLSIHSVEFLPESNQTVYARDFNTASSIATPFQYMRPLQIKEDWMKVLLLDSDFKKIGKGWIQWKKDRKLQISYNLFS